MKDYILLLKILFKNQYAHRIGSSGKPKLSGAVKTVLFIIPLVLLFCLIGGFVASVIPDIQTLSAVSNAVVSAVQLFALFLTMFNVMNVLYDSPDTPFLNTLPVKHTSVFFAKFTVVYVSTLAMTAAILLPTLLTISRVYAALGRAMFYGFFALVFIVALVAPVLPLFIVTLFSMPLSFIGTFFKGRSVLKTILSLLFYVLLMIGYLLMIYFLSSADGGNVNINGSQIFAGLGVFAKVMYPNKVLLDFALGIEAGKSFGISFAITAGMLLVMLLLAMLFYRRINQKKLETHSETTHRAASLKQSGVISSLIKKDFLHIVRNSHLAMSSLANIIICPVITAVMYFTGNMQADGGDMPPYLAAMLKLSYVVLYTLIFLGGANAMAMLAYTREGRSFYLSKSLPISPRDSIKAKFILALIPSAIVMVIQVILAIALYKLDILNVLLFALCASLTIIGATALHIYCDMRFGNVNWNTRQDLKQVSQGNIGSFIVVFWVMGVGLVAMVGGMVLSSFAEAIGGVVVALAVFWSILFVLSAVTCLVGLLMLRFKAEPYYDEIGERKFKPKQFGRARTPKNGGMLMK